MGYDPKQLMELARMGAIAQLDAIAVHFPDLIKNYKPPRKKRAAKVGEEVIESGKDESPELVRYFRLTRPEVKITKVTKAEPDINPKTGEPFKMSREQRERISERRKAYFARLPKDHPERMRISKSQKQKKGRRK